VVQAGCMHKQAEEVAIIGSVTLWAAFTCMLGNMLSEPSLRLPVCNVVMDNAARGGAQP
jgi:hypothetical protein